MNFIFQRSKMALLTAGFLLGFLALFAVHFATAEEDGVHYHANFALYVNGERDEFDNFTFYEEVQACQPSEGVRPEARVHMHEMVNHVIHVHDDGVTWGHFFANLGYTLSNNAIVTDDGVFTDGDGGELTFLLNGERTRSIANQLIQDEDKLLINYGDEDADTLQGRYNDITHDAGEYNELDDPGGCAGDHELSISDRVRHALGIR